MVVKVTMLSSAGHFPSPLQPNSSPWAHNHNPNHHNHTHGHQQPQQASSLSAHSHAAQQSLSQSQSQPKPSPLSSADNAPRSGTYLNAVQAVHTYYTTPSSYTHTSQTGSNSNSTSTSSLGTYSSSQQQQQHTLRRIPGGANLAEYRPQHQPAPPSTNNHHHPRARTHSLSIPLSSSKMSVNGTASPQSTRGMPSINAIAAGPAPTDAAGQQGRPGFDGPRSPPSKLPL